MSSLIIMIWSGVVILFVVFFMLWLWERRQRRGGSEISASLDSAGSCEDDDGCAIRGPLKLVPPRLFVVSLKPSSTGRAGRPLPHQARRKHVVEASDPRQAKEIVSQRCNWLGTVHFQAEPA